MWSHRSPYIDKLDNRNAKHGKELCDLLAVFEDDVFIFQDKACSWPTTGDLGLRWRRWHKRAIGEAARQVVGAERWLRNFPARVFSDERCTTRLPVQLPQPGAMKVHRIIVANGAKAACKKHFGSGHLGSLTIDTVNGGPEVPFSVGRSGPSGEYVHVFDEANLALILESLDTIPEFRDYLRVKERAIDSCKRLVVAGEENLLAHYLTKEDPDHPGKHGFGHRLGGKTLIVPPVGWAEYASSPVKLSRDAANEESYAWDALVARSAIHAIKGTQRFTTTGDPQVTEETLRLLNAEHRSARRVFVRLARNKLEAMGSTHRSIWSVLSPTTKRTLFTFVALRHMPDQSYDDYRDVRLTLLSYCVVLMRMHFGGADNYVGIGMGPLDDSGAAEDLVLLPEEAWTEEVRQSARRFQLETGVLSSVGKFRGTEHEYPLVAQFKNKGKHGRNDPCPCMSGRKWKKCHGQG